MTTVPSRGARVRRGGRRPGWVLLTTLLVLAIASSSVLVFTSRVELLKLAVVVSLWAAVVAAFASVVYRRQSETDQARTRDLKLVYDLQLDREISARREYELTVESQLRRELAAELRDQAADEVAALRAELATLRANLELLFETDLGGRPALETEHTAVRALSGWARDGDGVRVAHQPAAVPSADSAGQTAENPIIDVSEVSAPVGAASAVAPPQPIQVQERGSHRRAPDGGALPVPGGGWGPQRHPGPASHSRPEPPRQPEPWSRPAPPEPAARAAHWQPVTADGEWLPPGAPGSNWVVEAAAEESAPARRSRHSRPPEPAPAPPGTPRRPRQHRADDQPAPVRHSAEAQAAAVPDGPARHRSADPGTGAESAAELLARLQARPVTGRRGRRRRED